MLPHISLRLNINVRIELNGHTEQDFDHSDVLIRDGISSYPKGPCWQTGGSCNYE
jgi:hypothetical protein